MIFYNSPNPAPNPRRVRIFAAEKGIALDTRDLSIPAREHKSDEFVALNPRGQTPALQLDDGTVIAESVAIWKLCSQSRRCSGVTPRNRRWSKCGTAGSR